MRNSLIRYTVLIGLGALLSAGAVQARPGDGYGGYGHGPSCANDGHNHYGSGYGDPYGDYNAGYHGDAGYGYNYGAPSCDVVYCGYCNRRFPIDHFPGAGHVGYLVHTPRWGDVFYPGHLRARLDVDFRGSWSLFFSGSNVHRYRFGQGFYGSGRRHGRFGPALVLDSFFNVGHRLLHGARHGHWRVQNWRWRGPSYGRDHRRGGSPWRF